MRRVGIGFIGAALVAWGCSGADGGSPASSGTGGNGPGSSNSNVIEYKTIVNVVDAQAVAQIETLLSAPGSTGDYTIAAADFYSVYPDEYDFIYLILDHPIPNSPVAASFAVANRPVIAGTGLEQPAGGMGYGSRGRLKGVAGFQYSANGIPPFAHETEHYWANHLDPALGFGKDHDYNYDSHWGPTSVYGKLGGFDGATLKCAQPAGAIPPACQAESNGRFRYTTSAFGPNSNSLRAPYAPLELYMMGLVSQSEVPDSFTLLQDASLISYDSATDKMLVEAAGTAQITMSSIIARHGTRAAATEAEKHFTAAFVVVTSAPASQAVLDNVVMWQESLGDHQLVSGTSISFQTFTGGRATLETRIGRQRTSSDPAPLPPVPATCNVLNQDCGRSNVGCYDFNEPMCYSSKGYAVGEACQYANDCAAGAICMSTNGSSRCQAICNPTDNQSVIACSKLCPNNFGEVYSQTDSSVIGAICS